MKQIFSNLTLLSLIGTLLLSSQSQGATVSIKKSNTSSSLCPTTNPRCFFDWDTENSASASALRGAKSSAEFACTDGGGTVTSGYEIDSACTKIKAWVDSYYCVSVYEVQCDLSTTVKPPSISNSEIQICIKIMNEITPKNNPPETQSRAACINAIKSNYQDSLHECMIESLEHDRAASGKFALVYCDLAGRNNILDQYKAALNIYRGYNFRYIYEKVSQN